LLLDLILGRDAFPVRGILFDKVPAANWHVGWHQDQIIPVAERKDVPGFTAWSVKRGVPHVRPPASVLERMLTLRFHLDNCGPDNGALQVIPGSHKHGFLDDETIQYMVDDIEPIACEAPRGSVLMIRPLLLHASSPARSPSHRRVIHLEFASHPLPAGLAWPLYCRGN
jgi:ectoine hydroxylase-related dioxygenase (phytanoyl-CoA dioxygenase family)